VRRALFANLFSLIGLAAAGTASTGRPFAHEVVEVATNTDLDRVTLHGLFATFEF
jgi:hypothetical protein